MELEKLKGKKSFRNPLVCLIEHRVPFVEISCIRI